MKLIVVDTETSDLDPAKGAEVIELAWIEFKKVEEKWQPTFVTSYYIEFNGQISPKARAVNHISPERLKKENFATPRSDAFKFFYEHIESNTIMVAHNVDFDSKFFPEIKQPWICTYKASKHIWPNAPNHSNQVLRYWLDVDIYQISPEIKLLHPHQALYDVATTSSLLLKMLEFHTPEQLVTLSNQPVRLRTIKFGKYKGQEFNTIPPDYLRWLRSTTEDENIKHTIDSILR